MRYIRAVIVYIWAALVMTGAMPFLKWSVRKREIDFSDAMQKTYKLVHWFAGTIVRLTGIKLTVHGAEHIPAEGSILFVGNHQSLLDIPIFLSSVTRPSGFIAKEEIQSVPLLSRWTAAIGSIFIVRGETRKALEAVINAAKLLKTENHALVVFPEGTRSEDGTVGDFKAGSMKIASRSGSTIVPFCINGSLKIMPRDRKTFTPGSVELTFFSALSAEKVKSMDTNEIAEFCRQHVVEELSKHKEVV